MKTTNKQQTVKQLLQILGIAFIFLLTLNSCFLFDKEEEPEDVLPPITQTGENTFGCYIDGELFVPKDGIPPVGSISGIFRGLKAFYGSTILNINAEGAANYIHIYIYDIIDEGVYQLRNGKEAFSVEDPEFILPDFRIGYNFSAIRKADKRGERYYYDYYDSLENGGSVTITSFDPEHRVFSGTFSFKAINRDDPADIIEITEGRFDINLNTLNK